ncbi:hypothetical protein F4808DRAFT_11552 [Astrocystis sublimbata]|nr:hypothetical protein F4808DRAFT_11552 [Astrocystis sublimbata]
MDASDDPRVKFGLSCPEGGAFHICSDSSTKFIGCCDIDPCTPDHDGRYPIQSLFNATFSAASGIQFLPQSCVAPFDTSNWFTCVHARPPFLGCCTTNPCDKGCPPGRLVPATLSDDKANASQFIAPTPTNGPDSTTDPGNTTGSNATTDPGPSPTATKDASEGYSAKRVGTIVGTTLAGVLVLLIVIGVYLWYKRKEEDQDERERLSRQFLQDSNHTTTPSIKTTPSPAGKTESPSANFSRPFVNHQAGQTGPLDSLNTRDPHVSQMSELEGSLEWNR